MSITLYRASGEQVSAKPVPIGLGETLAECLIDEDGRIIYCNSEDGIFFYRDTEEVLYLEPRSTHQ